MPSAKKKRSCNDFNSSALRGLSCRIFRPLFRFLVARFLPSFYLYIFPIRDDIPLFVKPNQYLRV